MRSFVFTLCLLFAHGIAANDSGSDLRAFLNAVEQIEGVQGQFQQTQFDAAGAVVAEAVGSFKLLRPAWFLWDIQSPDSQLIIATPEHVWHYDRDLETATRRPASGSGAMAPLQILGGDEALLSARFAVSRTDSGDFVLRPLEADAGFEQVALALAGNTIKHMEIRDNLQQRVVIDFSEVREDTSLEAGDFAFTPPANADTFYYDE